MAGLAFAVERLRQPAWLQKAIRTGLAVSPGLTWWSQTGDAHGVAFAFAALCLSVMYNDGGLTPSGLAIVAVLAGSLLPGVTWLEAHPFACVPAVMAAMAINVLVRRLSTVPGGTINWLTIYVLYQASELSADGIAAAIVPALLVPPAALWVGIICFVVWPYRGGLEKKVSGPSQTMSVTAHVLCAALAAGAASTAAFTMQLSHVNWAIWSAMTVVQSGARDSLVKSGRRLTGAAIGCSAGFVLLWLLYPHPHTLAVVTSLIVMIMVAPETYIIAVSVRSALAILAAFQLSGSGVAAGLARIENIIIGVTIAVAVIAVVAPLDWWIRRSGRLSPQPPPPASP